MMKELFPILCVMIVATSAVRISSFPFRKALCISAAWGIIALLLCLFLSDLNPQQMASAMEIRNLIAAEFIELSLFMGIVFSSGTLKKILGCYPGIMIAVPIAALVSYSYRFLAGIPFGGIAGISGGMTAFLILIIWGISRLLKLRQERLYDCSLTAVLMCVIIYGLS